MRMYTDNSDTNDERVRIAIEAHHIPQLLFPDPAPTQERKQACRGTEAHYRQRLPPHIGSIFC
jgi:hypothetical protein